MARHGAGSGRRRRWTLITTALSVALGAYLLVRTLSGYGLAELDAAVRAIPAARLLGAGAFAAGSYLCLTAGDWLALRAIGRPLPYRYVGVAAFVALGVGHSIGLSGLSSGAIRYRFYARRGLTLAESAKLVLFCGLTVALGLMALGALALLLRPRLAQEITGLGRGGIVAAALACLAGVGLYLAAAAFRLGRLTIRRWSIEVPPWRIALAQVAVGSVNFALVSACLHQVLAAVSDVAYPGVASVFVIANAAVLVTNVPGGVGVIESVVVHLLPGTDVIGPLIAFRVVYFLVPLALGLLVFAGAEVVFRRRGRAGPAPGRDAIGPAASPAR
ncbi:lysylphosphatidylglycerol synthase transmembrane domain-containing protein [Methylobacterium sp. WSM2598]|uniref:lysylphosphatidylglycerol synthase transmembrane domain-containing protein n=1 Tax=Methylobacterium sp. WSM2598 TaxID=398261 RepID=UPI00035ECED2|nr:YbhN family protein [Methylobacterium sp. WSM2598]